jgi:hypothetical protein
MGPTEMAQDLINLACCRKASAAFRSTCDQPVGAQRNQDLPDGCAQLAVDDTTANRGRDGWLSSADDLLPVNQDLVRAR